MSADIDTSLVPSGGFGKCLFWLTAARKVFGKGWQADLVGPSSADAFADAAEQEENTAGADYVHIRVQQRNGKKSLTTVQVKWCLA